MKCVKESYHIFFLLSSHVQKFALIAKRRCLMKYVCVDCVKLINTTLLSYVALPLFYNMHTLSYTYPMLQAHLSLSVQTMAELVWPEHRYNYRYSVSTFVLAVSVIHDLVDSSRNCSGNL